MHLRTFEQFCRENKAEVGVLSLRQEIGAHGNRLAVFADNDTVPDRPKVLIAFPAVEVRAVKEVDGLGSARAGRDLRGLLFILAAGLGADRAGKEKEKRGRK